MQQIDLFIKKLHQLKNQIKKYSAKNFIFKKFAYIKICD